MKLLFVHQNFPGQFPHLAPAMARRGHDVLALTDQANGRPAPVKVARYHDGPRVCRTAEEALRVSSLQAEGRRPGA